MRVDIAEITQAILAVDDGINERWNRGDVDGALEVYSDDVSYFDPLTELRLDGHAAVEAYFRKVFEGKLKILRNDYLHPVVMVSDGGDMAVLHYNLRNIVSDGQGGEKPGTPWNSTQVFRHIEGRWRAVHVNWSITLHPGALQCLMS
ncbi:nuclear transport factor 2 family protein [Xanthomonas campestris pv. raphani]|uniref:YybH family protein n=1 Tax=Xanthomonas campestris TaxID=339 RepID=UPI002B23D6CB|nr:nuclear transport factor 2 family protein [Xanthomonas campestris]MEA9746752.1 nuclear transport factor 2 family protein [Xanthomonas campestris pv. raphani]MEA9751714.1 nuclear transport factor 2 family protein [Xanthomonas campestris pv. raphani]MEA9811909.1 nuclear transport factor 2 family protein [Xanthomonas campestris pv. raphani]MEA9848027.1 nuclear transport factor 2 family protein [Xanthomonas campestris pv. raphani]MEA9928686.1 nuclear transport factor 2 family protein [Xanthomon